MSPCRPRSWTSSPDLQQEYGSAVIIITHDLGVVAELADDILVMYAGRMAEYGSSDDIFARPGHPYAWGLLGSMPRLDRRPDGAAAVDPRHPAQPDQRAVRLPFPSPLRLRGQEQRQMRE